MAKTEIKTEGIKDLNVTNAKIAAGTIDVTAKITGVVPPANLGTGTASSSTVLYGDGTFKAEPTYDDNVIQSNIAMLGFKVAVNGSLTRYNLVDQSIDEFFDTSGVDASASTNENRVDTGSGANFYYDGVSTVSPTVTEDADDSGVDGAYTWYKWTSTGAGSYNTNTTQDHEYLVVAGGGGAGKSYSGGGGAGGYKTATGLSLTGGTTYTPTVGGGGAGSTSTTGTSGTDSSLAGTGISTITSTGGGGGGYYNDSGVGDGLAGGSGGGGGGIGGSGPENSGGAGTGGQGYAGGKCATSYGSGSQPSGAGGGGQSAVGADASGSGTATSGGNGGAGVNSSITGSTVGYAGGGGGGTAAPSSGTAGTATHGGGAGNKTGVGTAGTANTGGGGGGSTGGGDGADGGSGIVVLRRLTSTTAVADLTLQSTDVTAEAAPTYGEFVTLIENAQGTATLNTDIKGYISRDSGVTFTQGTLVDEGTWGTNKQILGFHDLAFGGSALTAMCYKITTHNQVASSKETRIYATSIGWR